MINRSYSFLEIREVKEDERIIEGIATTPTLARDGDILVTEGIQFKLPLPFLYRHSSPLGNVVAAKVAADGITVRIQVGAAGISQEIDEQWRMIKAGIVRGLSIGWRTLQEMYDKEINGYRIMKSEWLELSAVPVPADANAMITSVRSADEAILASLGRKENRRSVTRINPTSPGVSGTTGNKNMKIREQITQFENKRAASDARMTAIMEKSGAEGRTLDETETQEYDGLETELREIDAHLVRLKAQEARSIANAQRVDAAVATTPARAEAQAARSNPIIVTPMQPKGIGVARMAIAMIRSGGNPYLAAQLAETHWKDNPEVAQSLRAAVEAGDTTTSGWASQLLPAAQQQSGEFLELLRDAIVIGKLPLRKVPFNVAVPLQSGGGTYRYVGEGAGKPVTSPTFGNATLRFEKAAGIIVITDELARFGSPSAELLVRDEMLKGLTGFFDTIFLGTLAAVTNVQPAGILNGKSATAASGTTAAFFVTNMNTMLQLAITNKQDMANAYLIMSSGIAMALSSMINSLGLKAFPGITAKGGEYNGIPIVVSQAAGTNIILCFPDQILLAEDPGVRIDVSREATIEMDTTPTAGESSPITTVETIKSMFQNNMVAIRAEQYRTWKVGRTSAVEYISGANYQP